METSYACPYCKKPCHADIDIIPGKRFPALSYTPIVCEACGHSHYLQIEAKAYPKEIYEKYIKIGLENGAVIARFRDFDG